MLRTQVIHTLHTLHTLLALLALLAAAPVACGGRAVDPAESSREPSLVPEPGVDTYACQSMTRAIYAGQTIPAGAVTVSNDDARVVVHVKTTGGWAMNEVQIYVGDGPVPTNPAGNAAPGQFPYKKTFAAPSSSTTLVVALSELGGACFEMLTLAVHVALVQQGSGATTAATTESGWAHGNLPFAGQWGWGLNYLLCCDTPPSGGCTLTQGYWKSHNAQAKQPAKQKPWPISEGTKLCGRTWLAILETTPAGGEAWFILAHQWIAASLNVASGAADGAVCGILPIARKLLEDNCPSIPAASREAALSMATSLDKYNNGEIGPGHCD